MPYAVKSKKTGQDYYLHARETDSRGGKRLLYFFSKEVKEGVLESLPAGYVVTESEKTGLPLLKRA